MNSINRLHSSLGTIKSLYFNFSKDELASCGTNVAVEYPVKVNHPENIYFGNNIAIRGGFMVISHTAKLIIKDNVDISQNFTVVTGNHTICPPLDRWQIDCNHSGYGDIEKDVVIEEDVWIGVNVTVMPGVTIGRGSIIGACSNVVKNTPPYTISCGNPCKVLKMKFSLEEIIEREKILYPPEERLCVDYLTNIFLNFKSS